MLRLALRCAAAALALALIGPDGPAYLVRVTNTGGEMAWNLSLSAPNVVGGKVTYYIDEAGTADVTGEEFADAVRGAVQAWEDAPGASIAFTEDASRATTAKNASDKINRFGFKSGVLSRFVFASAFTSTSGTRILDVDVVFNPDVDSQSPAEHWSVQRPGDLSGSDVQGISTHEWGHGIGMDHIPQSRAVMFWAASYGNVHQRFLTTDDLAGAGHNYPAAAFATDFATVKGHVDVPGTTNDRGVQVVAVDFADGFPAASALTRADGTYTIEGLPPGVYRILAGPLGTGQVANHVYSAFWDGSSTTFLPAVRGQDGASDGSTGIVPLSAGQVQEGIDLVLTSPSSPNEPNDNSGTATPLALGNSVAGRIESGSDVDFYSFSGTLGQTVSIYVHAQQLGSDLNPRLFLRNSIGIAIAQNDSINGNYVGDDPPDLDCRILDYALPATGTYYIEVDPVSYPSDADVEDEFYVLTLLPGGGTPSSFTSDFTASPSVIAADGAAKSTLTFFPKSVTGTSSGSGLSVTFSLVADGDADGSLSGVTDHGDGSYTAMVTAAVSASGDTVRALVDGSPVSTVVVSYRGPVDFDASDFSSAPRRIRFDGSSQATVTLVPRDENGIAFGEDHDVEIGLSSDFDATVGPTVDAGDGSYHAAFSAGTTEGTALVTASVDGVELGGDLEVGLGFPLEAVVDDAVADLTAILEGDEPPPAKVAAKVKKARDLLAGVDALVAETDSVKILAAVGKALKQLDGARKKGVAVADLETELAEAGRQRASEAIDDAGPLVDSTKEQKALDKAIKLFGAGTTLLDADSWTKANGKYLAALKSALKVKP